MLSRARKRERGRLGGRKTVFKRLPNLMFSMLNANLSNLDLLIFMLPTSLQTCFCHANSAGRVEMDSGGGQEDKEAQHLGWLVASFITSHTHTECDLFRGFCCHVRLLEGPTIRSFILSNEMTTTSTGAVKASEQRSTLAIYFNVYLADLCVFMPDVSLVFISTLME